MSTPHRPHESLIAEMRDYCDRAGISPATLAVRAVNDGGFFKRMEAGGRCWPETEAKVREWMAANPPKPRDEAAA